MCNVRGPQVLYEYERERRHLVSFIITLVVGNYDKFQQHWFKSRNLPMIKNYKFYLTNNIYQTLPQ